MSYKDVDYMTRLDSHGWVEIYEPQIRRRDFADQSDGPLEFLQGESYESYRYRIFGERNAMNIHDQWNHIRGKPQEIDDPANNASKDPWPWE